MRDLDFLDGIVPYAAAFVCGVGSAAVLHEAHWFVVLPASVVGFYLGCRAQR